MIIAGQNKLLSLQVLTSSTGLPYISGTIFVVVYLESTDANNLKFWTTASTWENSIATSASFPTGSHHKAGMWHYLLSGSATVNYGASSIHFTFINGLGIENENSSSVVVGSGEHYIWPAYPLTSSDIPTTSQISASIWNVSRSSHIVAGSMGQAMQFSSSYFDTFISSRTTGSIPSISQISASVWNAIMTDHTTNGSAGKYLTDATSSGGSTTITSADIAAISASIWNATRSVHVTAGSMGQTMQFSSSYLDIAISTRSTGSVNIYESEVT